MAIIIEKPIVLATTQKPEIVSFHMEKDSVTKKWKAKTGVKILNEEGKEISRKIIEIKINEWNDFWTAFTSGTKLYQLANEKLAWDVEITDLSQEDYFVN